MWQVVMDRMTGIRLLGEAGILLFTKSLDRLWKPPNQFTNYGSDKDL
jgi:hypothetical protein